MLAARGLKKSIPVVNYSVIFPFEADFDPVKEKQWMLEHRHQCFYQAGVYILLIFGIQMFMKNRPRLELKLIAVLWNIFLAVFSIMGLCRTLPELLYQLNKYGFTHSVCDPNFIAHDEVTSFWTWAMAISKTAELGDTLLIVFRKHQLIFLHWYHHVATLLFSWYCYSEHAASVRWLVVMNFFVHSLMYSYYLLRAMRINVPKFIATTITTLQMLQMIVGCYVSYTSYIELAKSRFCHVPTYIATCGGFMYTSYFFLFSWFFYKAYISPKTKGKKAQ